LYEVDKVDRLLEEHVDIVASGKTRENHMMFFWQLVNVELWLQQLKEIQAAKAEAASYDSPATGVSRGDRRGGD
jgi:hypothetical protein